MHRYKELEVWQRAIEVSTNVYSITKKFPSDEKFGLISQLRRSSVSVASNIAEGAGRNSPLEFANFLSIAVGSVFELETQLLISSKVGILEEPEFRSLSEELTSIGNMLYKLQDRLRNPNN